MCGCVCIAKCAGLDLDEIKYLVPTSRELLYEYVQLMFAF